MVAREEAGPILNGIPSQLPDIDPEETQEWLDSLDGVIDEGGRTRARYVMLKLLERARETQVGRPVADGDRLHQHDPARGRAVVPRRRGRRAPLPRAGCAGTPRSWCTARSARASASAATSRPTPRPPRSTRSGFNHFFRGQDHPGGGDQVFFQGHASPGIYARAFLEGRLTEDQLDGFRQEKSHVVDGKPLACRPTRTRG